MAFDQEKTDTDTDTDTNTVIVPQGNRKPKVENHGFVRKTENPIVSIIGYGEIREKEDQIKIDSITILGDVMFNNLKSFRPSDEKEIEKISFEKIKKTKTVQDFNLPVFSLEKIFSVLFHENRKLWDYSFLRRMEEQQKPFHCKTIDDNNQMCFTTVLVSRLQKITIVIRSEQQMVNYLFEGDYLLVTKDFTNLSNTINRFYGEN